MTRHQYYYKPKGTRPGRKPSQTTLRKQGNATVEVDNIEVVAHIKEVQSDPDTDYGYQKMCVALMLAGYFINHKKVYRIMKEEQLLKPRHKKQEKTYARYRIVTPNGPLEVLEMDIKYVWLAQARRHVYILTVIDTFTRHVLHWQAGFTMNSTQVKWAWEDIIANHLQPADLLSKKIHIEVRNDNGPQFGAKVVRQFFEQNHLDQVFTHPYTPQENGHVESFHAILSSALGKRVFWDLEELETRLTVFYEKYNNTRLHASIANLPPRLFWELWDKGLVERKELKNKKIKFKLLVPYQQLSGNGNLREVPCLNFTGQDVRGNLSNINEVAGPGTLQNQPSVQRLPSVVPC
jgi:transposase InsO family protein